MKYINQPEKWSMDNHDNSQRVWTSSSLGRALNPAYPTNLAVILLTLVAGAVTAVITILNGGAFLDSFVSGGRIGLYLFLCWALTREIDPDHEESAFGSILFGLAGLAFVDQPALLVGFWMIGILRLGKPDHRTDGNTTRYNCSPGGEFVACMEL